MKWKERKTSGPDGYFDWLNGPAKKFATEYQPYDLKILDSAGNTIFDERVMAQKLPSDAVEPAPLLKVKKQPPLRLGNNPVVIGVIDEGLAIGHDRFRSADGTSRIAYTWLQDRAVIASTYFAGSHPSSALPLYGRELSKHGFRAAGKGSDLPGIDDFLKAHTRNGQLDETAFYQAIGQIDFRRPKQHNAVAQRIAHGTSTMDLAGGYDPSENRTDRPIICVQLPSATVADTSGVGLEKYVLEAVSYILQRAADLANDPQKPLPVVINFSSGMRAGPHNGTSVIEAVLDKLIENRRSTVKAPTDMVLPAGNSLLIQSHAHFELKSHGQKKAEQSVQWRIIPDDKTFSYLELWMPDASAAGCGGPEIALTLTPPNGMGPLSPVLTNTKDKWTMEWSTDGGDVVAAAYYDRQELIDQPLGAPRNGRMLIALLPTFYHNAPGALSPSGDWTVTLTNKSPQAQTVDGWVQWDTPPIGYEREGRQSYLWDKEYRVYVERNLYPKEPMTPIGSLKETDDADSVVKRASTINAIAGGKTPVVAAANVWQTMKPTPYSSSGPLLPRPGQSKPAEFAPWAMQTADISVACPGVLSAGTANGSVVSLNGTSVSSPQVARLVADYVADWKPGLPLPDSKAYVKKAAKKAEKKNPDWPSETPERIGHGRTDLTTPRDGLRISQIYPQTTHNS
ncbi:hypothetical protein NUH88_17675 [Nisaea acidiphila]|uniref:Peptidase S8/S53 domain-containing protein n=1 Tax=Nisaea acidiphila TaxID=1862145 RepID=A0A9J7ASB2_9PROT|nr:hypothetical protein [Nisaea acidiphila]UUX49220.1 hypothetical protein NUH88_17675 [Nisaea acidiphila]